MRADTADSVSLTPSVLLQTSKEIRVAAPPHDAERIAALKQAINSGTYEVDARTISDRLIGTERVLGQRSFFGLERSIAPGTPWIN